MTMRLTVKNEDQSRTAAAVLSSDPSRVVQIAPGQAGAFWIHQHAKLTVSEVQEAADSKPLHPATDQLLGYFAYEHLPPHLQAISKPFGDLARDFAGKHEGAEATVCLRKLLEAKDCAVRAALSPPAPERAAAL